MTTNKKQRLAIAGRAAVSGRLRMGACGIGGCPRAGAGLGGGVGGAVLGGDKAAVRINASARVPGVVTVSGGPASTELVGVGAGVGPMTTIMSQRPAIG